MVQSSTLFQPTCHVHLYVTGLTFPHWIVMLTIYSDAHSYWLIECFLSWKSGLRVGYKIVDCSEAVLPPALPHREALTQPALLCLCLTYSKALGKPLNFSLDLISATIKGNHLANFSGKNKHGIEFVSCFQTWCSHKVNFGVSASKLQADGAQVFEGLKSVYGSKASEQIDFGSLTRIVLYRKSIFIHISKQDSCKYL